MLHYVTLCTTLLMTTVHVRAQCERPHLGGNRILADERGEPFADGVTLKVKCSPGYVPLRVWAKRSITCTGTQWSELELECKKRSCGNPGDIPNGRYQFPPTDGVLFGSTITAVCNDGYQIVGAQHRNCREFGWDGRAPVCEVVKCERPPSVTNGEFEPQDEVYDYGQSVTYTCSGGFHLIGPSEVTCSLNGNFQPQPPQCLHVSCERLTIPNAVRIEGKSPPYTYKNFVRYRCDRGYKMDGSDYLTCTEKGWNPPPPVCTVVTCPKPSEIENGSFEPQYEIYEYKKTVTYTCNEGFYIEGTSTISCTEDGTFEMNPRSCKVITCEWPFDPYGYIDESLPEFLKYNDTVHISCDKGYKIKDSDQLTCKANGWNPSLPQCVAVKCPPPPSIPNGKFNPELLLYQYGQSVTYSCNKGFRLQHKSVTSCSEDGTFEPFSASEEPQCLVVTCSAPDFTNNVKITTMKGSYTYLETITFSCEDGFHLEGPKNATCNEHGMFKLFGTPSCKEQSKSQSTLVWILIVAVVLVFLFMFAFCCYKRSRKDKKAKQPSPQENCSLVNMSASVPTTVESESKSMY